MMMTRFYRLSLIVALLVLLTSCAVAPKVDPAKINKAARINTELGVMYLRKGQHELSMQKLSKAIEQDVDYAPAHESIAILYEELGEIGKADKHYRRALAIEDDSSSTLNNYGQFLCRQNKLERADKYFQRAFKDPLFAHPELIYTNAGICASQQPDVQKAETYFRQALQVMPEYLPALKQMALLTFSQDNYLGSRAYLQRYGSRAPLTADLLWIALRVEHRLNDTIAEKKYATDLKRRYPQSKEAGFLKKWKNE
ncbi:MAG: type IV pilus biogenesis/stability protein PilW [Gammaproteobacteria bacterium]